MSTLYFDARYENTEMSVPDLPTSRKEREKWGSRPGLELEQRP